jgi:hypothetical protein
MPITLPHCGRGSGSPGRCGGRDGGRGSGGRGGPLPCRKRNPMLASNLRNSTLATSIPPLPCTQAPLAAVSPPSSCCRWAPVYYFHCCLGSWVRTRPSRRSCSLVRTTLRRRRRAHKMVLMINILSKNDSSKNNHAYSLNVIRGMGDQLSSLEKPILAGVQLERPGVCVCN